MIKIQAIKKRVQSLSLLLIMLCMSSVHAAVIHITSIQQFDELLAQAKQDKKTVVVDFFATWCGPCVRMTPVFESFSNSHQGNCLCLKVDVDSLFQLSHRYGISRLPTIAFFKDGERVTTLEGTQSKEQLTRMLNSVNGQGR